MEPFRQRLATILQANALFRQAVGSDQNARATATLLAIRDAQEEPAFVYGINGMTGDLAVSAFPSNLDTTLQERNFILKSKLALLLWQRREVVPCAAAIPATTAAVARDFLRVYTEVFHDESPHRVRQHAENCLASLFYENVVVYDGSIPVAIGSCACQGGVAGIYNIACRTHFQGRGFGKAALIKALKAADDADTVFLECRKDNQLLDWYKAQGFMTYCFADLWQL